jgi:hypothetical protein
MFIVVWLRVCKWVQVNLELVVEYKFTIMTSW